MNELIFEELARLFQEPCEWGGLEWMRGEGTWCKRLCGKVGHDKCWKRYFALIEAKRRKMYGNRNDERKV